MNDVIQVQSAVLRCHALTTVLAVIAVPNHSDTDIGVFRFEWNQLLERDLLQLEGNNFAFVWDDLHSHAMIDQFRQNVSHYSQRFKRSLSNA